MKQALFVKYKLLISIFFYREFTLKCRVTSTLFFVCFVFLLRMKIYRAKNVPNLNAILYPLWEKILGKFTKMYINWCINNIWTKWKIFTTTITMINSDVFCWMFVGNYPTYDLIEEAKKTNLAWQTDGATYGQTKFRLLMIRQINMGFGSRQLSVSPYSC